MEPDLSDLWLDMSPTLVPVLLHSNFLVLLLWRLYGTLLTHIGSRCKYYMELGRLSQFIIRFESSKTREDQHVSVVPMVPSRVFAM